MRTSRRLGIAAALAIAACTIGQKKSAVLGATADAGRRHDLFEATLRALDEKPEYVDEFFQLALRHPRTLDRFVGDTASRLDDHALSATTADALVRNPAGLREILVSTLDAARNRPEARRAIAEAISARPSEAARAMAERSQTVDAATRAMVDVVLERAEVRGGFLDAMRARQDAVATILADQPDLAVGLARAFLGVSAGKVAPGIREKLRALLGGRTDDADGGARVEGRSGSGRPRR